MRSRVIRRSACVDDGQRLVVPQRLERGHRRVKAEEPVEVDRGSHRLAARTRNRDRGPEAVIVRFAVRNDHVEAIDRATLEDRDHKLAACPDGCSRAAKERRRKAERQHRHRARFQKDPAIHNTSSFQKRWNSGDPSRSARSFGGLPGSVTPGMLPDARRVAKFMRLTSPPAETHASAVLWYPVGGWHMYSG